ncbi:NADH dehydrogenase [ubiquinone] flavoprotein 3, mitochondrial-like [Pteropus alecto]|uniref:NADH dehydrogenase [ubiquinone] flavoprotein 3, mitochondrial-like n=1 Tax=Pteropus alecto TaxID=9402 RepID=UPI000768824B|nr:NADH dehydrogenase [ubiquinone] flavoprotein 3, mitochondrial-like [Pteropus alecto]
MAGARAQFTQSCVVHGGTFGYFGVKLEGTGEFEAGFFPSLVAPLLWQGRVLKTMLLEGPVFQRLAPAVSLSAKSGKSNKGLPPNPKKQSLPKDPTGATMSTEPSDNTTYKNLQHHDYTGYTFLDLNLNLSKFRLPRPSSRQESPRH